MNIIVEPVYCNINNNVQIYTYEYILLIMNHAYEVGIWVPIYYPKNWKTT